MHEQRLFSAKARPAVLTPAQEALRRVDELYAGGDYRRALAEIRGVEEKFPGCSKAAKHYRGKVGMALLNEQAAEKDVEVMAKPHKP